jgi:CheY-like chemotaxis protein
MLPMLGFSCTACGDPLEALDVFKASPDMVISDIRMPGLTGDRLARQIAEIRPDVPIVLLTGRGLGDEDALMEEGVVYGILHKPITVPTLAATLRKFFVEKP